MTKGSGQSESTQTFEQIADQFVLRIRNGEHPSINEYKSAFPEYSADIDELFPTLAELEKYDPLGDSNQPTTAEIPQAPAKLGDYIIKREIGRGGMGVVYEAEHETLRRRVALKVLPAHFKKQNYEKRFMREARAAGQLHHTNIVPIFEVGKCNGMNFYAMQYIHGQNLDVVIEELKQFERNTRAGVRDPTRIEPVQDSTIAFGLLSGNLGKPQPSIAVDESGTDSPRLGDLTQADKLERKSNNGGVSPGDSGSSQWAQIGEVGENYYRRVARVGIQIADALEYAHNHGILHRDIKPSNLILDTDGVVWVTDFGLAKDGSDNLTHTGDIVGTLRYMAPERFKGDADVRSEVYSLGLTLYELCTLTHAFDQSDRAQLIQQVTSHDPVSPRRIRPEIPRDLETVIAKAIAREPSRRYSSARQMSVDLQRFVSDRPVHARRVSVLERTYRWAKRHPARAALVSCLAIICLMITGGSMYMVELGKRHATELERKNRRVIDEKFKTEEALEKAERANLSSRAHLYYSYLGQADATRSSGKQGQNFASLNSVRMAAGIVPTLGLTPEKVERRNVNLRSTAIAAMTHWDVDSIHRWNLTPGWTTKVAFDFKNGRVAQSDQQGNIAIRKFGSQKADIQLPGPGEQAWLLLFSPNGKYLTARHHHPVTMSKPITCLWDVDEQEEVFRLDQVSLGSTHCFSTDSTMFAICRRNKSVEVYETGTGEIKFSFKPDDGTNLMQFTGNNTRLILAHEDHGSVDFWTLDESPAVVESIAVNSRDSKITALSWNDRLNQLAVAVDDRLLVWPANDLDSEPTEFTGHGARIVRAALHPLGKVVMSTSWDGTTRLFDLVTRKEVVRLEGHRLTLGGFDETGCHIGYTSRMNDFGVWKLPETYPVRPLVPSDDMEFRSPGKFVPGQPDLIACATSNGIEVWNHQLQEIIALIPNSDTNQICFSEAGNSIYASSDDGIRRWEFTVTRDDNDKHGVSFDNSEPETIWEESADAIDVSERRQLIAAKTNRNYIKLINLKTNEFRNIGPHSNVTKSLFTPDGQFLITLTWHGHGIKVWNTESGEFVKDLEPQMSSASFCINETDNTLAINSGDVRSVWSIEDWSKVYSQRRSKPDGWPGGAAFSPSGRIQAVTYSRYVPQLVEAKLGNTIATLESPNKLDVGYMDWSDDGQFLAIANEKMIQVWNIHQIRERLNDLQIGW